MAAFLRSSSIMLGYSTRYLFSKSCIRGAKISLCNYDTSRMIGTGIRCLATQHLGKAAYLRVQPDSTMGKLDRMLYRVDSDARRTGRVSMRDVEDIFSEIRVLGTPSTTQTLMLIRCCGSFISDELPETRTRLVSNIWKSLGESGAALDISHYNALLKVYIENDHKFVPLDVLAEMQNKNIEPNRVTYQRLIARYCQDGDLEGASKILEHMKQNKIPINENVFNSMIMGHAKNDDMEGAKGILDIMRNAHLEPNSDTYAVLLSGYARKGDIQAIRQTLKESEKNDVYLLDKDYMDIIYSLAVNGFAQHVEEILGICNKQAGYNQEVINTVLPLVNQGLEDVAYLIVKTMPSAISQEGISAPVGQFFIRQLVRAGRPVEKIVAFCEDLRQSNKNQVGLKKALEVALIHKKTETAITLMRVLKEQNEPLRPHYFWPLFVHLRTQKDPERVYSVIRDMQDLEVPVSFDTLQDWIFPLMDFKDPDLVIQKLKDMGLTVGAVVNPLVHYLVEKGDLTTAAQLVEKYMVRVTPNNLTTPLAAAVSKTNDLGSLTTILAQLQENVPDRRQTRVKRDWIGMFLLEYINAANISTGEDALKLEPILLALKQKGLAISSSTVDLINSRLGHNINENITALLEGISTLSMELPDEDRTLPRDMAVEELESHLIELKSKGMNTRGVLRHLLLQYARLRNFERTMEIKNELDLMGFKYTMGMYAVLMDVHTASGDLQGAFNYYKLHQSEDPDFKVDDHKILNLAALMVREGKAEDAIDLIKKHHAKNGGQKEKPEFLARNVWRLLNAAAETKEVDNVKQLFDLVTSCGYAEVSNAIVGALVKVHLLRDDIDSALKEFEKCCKTYGHSPWKNDIMVRLINAEDSDRLQRVLDLSTEIHGESNVLFDLVIAFAECGKIKPALKILQTPGLRIYPQRLAAASERLLLLNKVTEMENIVTVLKHVPDVNKDDLYYQLLRAYCKEDNKSKALDLWTTLQEENVQPSDRTLVYLADFLKKHNIDVPFAVPTPTKSPVESLSEAIAAQDVEAALDIKKRLDAEGRQLGMVEQSQLIELLLQKDNLSDAINVTKDMLARRNYPINRILRFLMIKLAQAGDVDMIDYIGRVIPQDLQRTLRFNNELIRAYINSGRTNEALEILETTPADRVESFPKGGVLAILQTHPELLDRVHTMCQKQAALGNTGPYNMLWVHYMLQCNYTSAEQIFTSSLVNCDRLDFMSLVKKAQEDSNEELASNLVGFVTRCSTTRSKARGLAYICHVEILRTKGKLDEASKVLEKAVSEGLVASDFPNRELNSIHSDLKAAGKPVPFVLPQQNITRSVQQADDSSSSSSSSDDEVQAKKV